jgi:hypothetical protein
MTVPEFLGYAVLAALGFGLASIPIRLVIALSRHPR